MDFILNNAGIFAIGYTAVSVVAGAVVNLTPTPRDDAVFSKVYRVIEMFAGIITSKAKQ